MRRALERLRAALSGGRSKTKNAETSRHQNQHLSTVACTITLPNGKTLPASGASSSRDVAFRMPAEFEPHDGCWVAWPRRADVWRDKGEPAKAAFAGVVRAIARFEPVTVIADDEHVELWCCLCVARGVALLSPIHFLLGCFAHTPAAALARPLPDAPSTKNKTQYAEARASLPNEVRVVRMPHDDSWLRDTAPTFVHARVRAPCPSPQPPPVLMATDWRFNGWGDLYGSYERDKQVAERIGKEVGVPVVGVDMVLEGGSIHVDGEG